MILRKITIDGQEIHVQISKEEAVKLYNQETLIFTDELEKEHVLRRLNQEGKPRFQSKRHRLIQMLPFMDDETIHDLVQKIVNEGEIAELDITSIMPFVDEADATLLFKKALSGENPKINPIALAPFVEDEALSVVVDEYIAGRLSDTTLDGLYPFLNDADLKRLFKHIMDEA